jgi:hypothetical protein
VEHATRESERSRMRPCLKSREIAVGYGQYHLR